ncbi:hypothetical protein [Glycomyces albidus]|uniref:Uncharacterized protein n=1 Tax=Glycomyces albidus TaxID=2656774 RepID=A0A6L5G2K1_9ACTN|nr:hypothetical protein [Glycomyces albidus]MQM24376.1 hypothetical protein [Glycomyces albidus]
MEPDAEPKEAALGPEPPASSPILDRISTKRRHDHGRPLMVPDRPGTLIAAQVFVGLQAVALVCCGILPVFFWWPAFMAAVVYFLPVVGGGDSWLWIAMAIVPIGAAAYAVVTIMRLGNGDRRSRTWVGAGLAVLIALAVAGALLMWVNEHGGIRLAVVSALPSVLLQSFAWMCTHVEPTEQWFRECESYLDERRP